MASQRLLVAGTLVATLAIGLAHTATRAEQDYLGADKSEADGSMAHNYASWAADPTEAGPDLPPAGRSLFDFVFTEPKGDFRVYELPFPFSALIDRIRTHLDHREIMGGTRFAIIPIGRSLQRVAAAPDFFDSPRTVVAVTGEPSADAVNGGMLLKDRLYIAYVEKTNSLEVISYNETAGRFEFQLVKDYRAGAEPKVYYADRAICISCHQNHAPIFSRPMWRETNANGQVADMLRAAGTDMRLSTQANNGFPDDIERAAIRATDLVMLQTIWQHGCEDSYDQAASRRCRAAALTSMLQHGLSGKRGFDSNAPDYREDFVATLSRNWAYKWPQGLSIARSSITDRNPIAAGSAQEDFFDWKAAAHIPPSLDPLRPRLPQETLYVASTSDTLRFIYGWANSFPAADFSIIDQLLLERAADAEAEQSVYRARCRARQDSSASLHKLRCMRLPGEEGSVSLYGHAENNGMALFERPNFGIGGKPHDIELVTGPATMTGEQYVMHASPKDAAITTRLRDGRRLVNVRFTWNTSPVEEHETRAVDVSVEVFFVDDFIHVRHAIGRLLEKNPELFEAQPLVRARMMPALLEQLQTTEASGRDNTWCCIDDTGMPSVTRDAPEVDTAAMGNDKLRPFFRYCATCHLTGEEFPPNFLSGSASQVAENLRSCAPRMLVRLSAWLTPATQRVKSPMPPATALPSLGTTEQYWASSDDLESMRAYVEGLARESNHPAGDSTAAVGAYEGLPSCLPTVN